MLQYRQNQTCPEGITAVDRQKGKNRGMCRNEKGMKQRGEKRKEQVKQEYNNATFHAYSMGLEW